jgi:hypothetical protein
MTGDGSDTRRSGSQGPRCRSRPRYRIIIFIAGYCGEHRQEEGRRFESCRIQGAGSPRSGEHIVILLAARRRAAAYYTEQLCLQLLFFRLLLSTTSATMDDGDHAGSANRQVLSLAQTLHRRRRRIRGSYGYGVGRACCRRVTMTFSQDNCCLLDQLRRGKHSSLPPV